jgi:hypothetical protein
MESKMNITNGQGIFPQRFVLLSFYVKVWLLFLVFAQLLICSEQVRASDVPYRVNTVLVNGVSDGFRTYAVIRRNGYEYRTDQVGTRFNQHIWNDLSSEDRHKLIRIYGWSLNRRIDHFGNAVSSEMADFYNDEAGWTDLVEALKERRMGKDYPRLREAFGPGATLDIPEFSSNYPEVINSVEYRRATRLAEEVVDDFEMGRRLYHTLTEAKWEQVSVAVKGISGPLIQIMVDNFITPFVTHGAKATSELAATMYNFANELKGFLTDRQQPGKNPPTPGELIALLENLLNKIEQVAEEAATLVENKLAELGELSQTINTANEDVESARRQAGTAIVEDLVAQHNQLPAPDTFTIKSTEEHGTYEHWQDMRDKCFARYYTTRDDVNALKQIIRGKLDEIEPAFHSAISDMLYPPVLYTYFAGIDQNFQGPYLELKHTLEVLEIYTKEEFYQPFLDKYTSNAAVIADSAAEAENLFTLYLPEFNKALSTALALDDYQLWMGSWDYENNEPIPATWKASDIIGPDKSLLADFIPIVATEEHPSDDIAQDNFIVRDMLQPARSAMVTGMNQRQTWMNQEAVRYTSLRFNFESSLSYVMAAVDEFDALHSDPAFESWWTSNLPDEAPYHLYQVNMTGLLERIAAQPTAEERLKERLKIIEELEAILERELVLERRLEIAQNFHLADVVEMHNFRLALFQRFEEPWHEIKQDFTTLTGIDLHGDEFTLAMEFINWQTSYYFTGSENPSWRRTPQNCRSRDLKWAIMLISGKTSEYYLLQDLYNSMKNDQAYYLSMSQADFSAFNAYVIQKIGPEPNLGEWIIQLQMDGAWGQEYPARRLVNKARDRQNALISLYNGIDPPNYFTGISGRVLTSSGTPVSGVTILLSGALNSAVITDSEGYYRFEYLPQGNYHVAPSGANEFQPSSHSLDFSGEDITADLILPSNEHNGYTFGGQILNSSDNGMAGIRVQFLSEQDVFFSEQLSDPNGRFSITGLPASSYKVQPTDMELTFQPAYHNVSIPPDAANLRFQVYEYATLGIIIEPQQARLAGAAWRLSGTTQWRASGYAEQGLPAGTYMVEYQKIPGWKKPLDRQVRLEAGQTKDISDFYSRIVSLPAVILLLDGE